MKTVQILGSSVKVAHFPVDVLREYPVLRTLTIALPPVT